MKWTAFSLFLLMATTSLAQTPEILAKSQALPPQSSPEKKDNLGIVPTEAIEYRRKRDSMDREKQRQDSVHKADSIRKADRHQEKRRKTKQNSVTVVLPTQEPPASGGQLWWMLSLPVLFVLIYHFRSRTINVSGSTH